MLTTALVWIVARAGSGSGGFGGGGYSGGGGGYGGGGYSGGGGGYGGGGYGGGGYGGASLPPGAVAVILIVIVGFFLLSMFAAWQAKWAYRRARDSRAGAIRLAAAEAATDDRDFEHENVLREAERLWTEVQSRWTEGDRKGLAERIGPDLMVEWGRRLDDLEARGWRNVVEPHGRPQIEYLGLVNREGEEEDRVIVRITATIDDYMLDSAGRIIRANNQSSTTVTVSEWWTLEPPRDRWRVLSIEQDTEGRHNLERPVVAVPWSDERVRDTALVETQTADGVRGTGMTIADIAPAELGDDARAAALDLALADGRFAPDVLAIVVRRAVEAWAEAIDGDDETIERLADRRAIDDLLYGGDNSRRTRIVVRGGHVDELLISSVDPHRSPATMTVQVRVGGRIYVEDRDTTTVLAGSPDRDSERVLTWTFSLVEAAAGGELPWRLTSVSDRAVTAGDPGRTAPRTS